ncbi:MAG: Xaa-Pro peptidase family protein [Thermoplasmatales archaeon]|jgi:Xaa-Pro dipeptidase|nr:Xaa-Pro peptidase family protein [Candidatus Thermoplasmatota archaeon]MCL6002847.1 Xaa-Pro peptidase family protein [Candidatus Thermoplasmatota archaeon]MDA8054291.1 Xaa-Pro peptidase family protein [Thermoplasmatales archaeon]
MDVEKLFDLNQNVEGILIYNGGETSNDPSFFYFTQLTRGLFEGSYVFLTRKNLKVITSQLEEETARSEDLDVEVFPTGKRRDEILKEVTKDVTFVGINYSGLSHTDYLSLKDKLPNKEFVDVGESISSLRQVKSDREISKLKEAARIVSRVGEEIPGMLKEGMTENELAAKVNYEMMKNGASSPSFDTIAAFGPDAAEPHFSGGVRKLTKGEVVLVDFGAKFQRYCSDMTRSYFFGKPDREMEEMYDIVFKAQDAGFKAIRSGENGKIVDGASRKVIDSSKFKGKFIHSLGHGVGLNVHDHPALGSQMDFFLKENMVITVEPGVYIPKKGGVRIEDDVVVTKNGCQIITTAPRELQIV